MYKLYTRPLNARSALVRLILNRWGWDFVEDTSFSTLAELRTKFGDFPNWPCLVRMPGSQWDTNETVIGTLEDLQIKEQINTNRDARRQQLAAIIEARRNGG